MAGLTALSLSISSFAQSANNVINDTKLGTPAVVFFSDARVSENDADLFKYVNTDFPECYFTLMRRENDDIGFTHARYKEFYKGIEIVDGEYIIHRKGNVVSSMNGKFYPLSSLSVVPSISESIALSKALGDINADKYKWQMPEEEQWLKMAKSNQSASWFPKGSLVILPDLFLEKNGAAITASNKKISSPGYHLAWKFDVYADSPLGRYNIYVDAITGKVLFKENRICTTSVVGTAVTKYSGTQQITTDSVSPGVYYLRDLTRASGVVTYNMAKGTNYGTATIFTDADNLWNTTTNQDDAANDAHFGAEKTYDYYLSVHSRNSYNNLGGNLLSYVHYSTNYNNAYWDGVRMTYGDGNGTTFSPLTELDICGHELTHGVTEYSSNLTYSYESGALNEAFSDIFGVTIDFYANGNNADWLIGNKSYTPATPNDALRYMNNPNLGAQPDTYKGTSWYTGTADNGGVHTNSGVLNYWYYLLSVGGSGTNDKGFVFNVAGIGINKARLIAYRTNSYYLTAGSQYVDAGVFSIQAANDIFGMCSAESFAVKNAWDAVGITGLNILSGTSATAGTVCSGSNLQLNAAGGNSYSWTGPGGFTSTAQNPLINNFTGAKAGTYTCVITYAPGCSATNNAVASIKPLPTVTVTGAGSICQGSSLTLTGTATSGGGNTGLNSTPLAIPDNPGPAVTSSIFIDNAGLANSVVSVKIDSLTHTWMSDVKVELIAPNGSSIIVVSGAGSSGDGFINTVFSATSTTVITGTWPFTGTYKPSQSFSLLTGSGNGEWKLRVSDLVASDAGTLWKWSLIVAPSNAVVSTWSPSTGLSNPSGLSTAASPSSTTSYTLTVSNTAGCTASAPANVNVNIPHAINLKNNNPYNVCPSSPVTLNAGAGSSYLWNTGATTPTINITSGGSYWVNVDNCSKSDTAVVVQYASNPQGQLKVMLQGFYSGSGLMTPVLFNAGLSANNTDCDSVTVEIRSASSPYPLVQSAKGILKTNGDVLFTPLCNCISRDYYVVVRTRNGIETWSKNPVHFNASTIYRFDN